VCIQRLCQSQALAKQQQQQQHPRQTACSSKLATFRKQLLLLHSPSSNSSRFLCRCLEMCSWVASQLGRHHASCSGSSSRCQTQQRPIPLQEPEHNRPTGTSCHGARCHTATNCDPAAGSAACCQFWHAALGLLDYELHI